MEHKQYYVEVETRGRTKVYECRNLNESKGRINKIIADFLKIKGHTSDFKKVLEYECDQEDFIEGLKSVENEMFLKICYK